MSNAPLGDAGQRIPGQGDGCRRGMPTRQPAALPATAPCPCV